MKTRSFSVAALVAATAFGAGTSFAEPTEAASNPSMQNQSIYRAYPGVRPGQQGYMQRNRGESQRDFDQRWRNEDQRLRNEPGAGPDHRFHRGDRLPPEYRSRQYVVDDWRGHHLNAPPRGYHWVQNGGDYMLVAIATGLIVDLLLNH
jgi:Ni/Co efflux regulator RcnB